jgi:hypothetical protein
MVSQQSDSSGSEVIAYAHGWPLLSYAVPRNDALAWCGRRRNMLCGRLLGITFWSSGSNVVVGHV